MGEVYRATDTKLNRGVAIKVLRHTFANDPDRMARFAREAQVLASLNHPQVPRNSLRRPAAVYDVSPDGKRVPALLDAEGAKPKTHLRVMPDVDSEIRRRTSASGK
ncbi:MAG: hypothetical protein M3Z36_07020 [Acidobacteriota bacterium]|nr:hypothetical protein [Acidobacteriota bacterium]